MPYIKKKAILKDKKMIKKKKNRPFISIITVVKNDEKKISKTIKSVLQQKYRNFEYIVIDGLSSDNTLKKIKKNKFNIDLIVSKKDKNMWQAMNRGIKLSSGSIIGILNSGDVYYKNTLKLVAKYFKEKKKLDYLFGPVKKDRVLFRYEPEKIFYRFNIYPSHSSGFFISSYAQKKIGFYDEKLKFGADHDFFFKMIVKYKMNGIIAKKNEVFGKFDMSGISSKIPIYKTYFYEMKIRFKNGQNLFYIFFLYCIKILNKFYRVIINK